MIARVIQQLPQGQGVLLGPGDDAAVVAMPDGRVVATTDLLLEGRHFRRDWSGPYDIGRKAAAQNLVDVAAMGAVPIALLVAAGLPAEDVSTDWIDALTRGLREECAEVGASVVGGDLVRADGVVLGITALGDLEGRKPVRRGGAQPGDVVAIVGRLGYAAAGLALLRSGLFELADFIAAHRRPHPPYSCGPEAAELGATAMIDVSDGLIQDLGHIASASGVRVELDSGALAIPDALAKVAGELDIDSLALVLTGGDDHALVATFPPETRPAAPWRVVGTVASGSGVVVDGRPYDAAGWDHFRD